MNSKRNSVSLTSDHVRGVVRFRTGNLKKPVDKLMLKSPSFSLRSYAYGYRSFSVCVPKLWNSLPFHIKSSPSVDVSSQESFLSNTLFL